MAAYADLNAAQKDEARQRAAKETFEQLERFVMDPSLTPPPAAASVVDAIRARIIAVAEGYTYQARPKGDVVFLSAPDA